MTIGQTGQVMDILTMAYPQFYSGRDAPDPEKVLKLWASMFEDDDVVLVVAAVKALIASKEDSWPPSIGAVKARIRQITSPQEMTEVEAWALVQKAIRNSAYNSQREFEALPGPLRRLVGSPNQLREWAVMDTETVSSVVASNFQRSYKARAASDRAYNMLPADVRALAEGLAQRLALEEAET